ncbi:winged helix-turn-helix domain-containing protein [Vibrio sp. D420a]|uniref:winged helix-turn-helix domain-containing protein n=1 Tax=Vibrio sp. D420a TaxID=2836895 RepID=UPI0025569C16|nr:winged helix-turn-helix domain-containing protein [Vibrio sp. D420a]MDK9763422.1 winged helix-turn-helix domain-containing protein [Vibrio sp. D420a]
MDNNKITLNDLVLELDTCTLRSTTSSHQVNLSYSECLILNLLYKESPKTIKRDVLLEQCWPGKIVTSSSLNVAIKNLRNALITLDAPFKVVTVQKEGYCIPALDSLASIPTTDDTGTKVETHAEAAELSDTLESTQKMVFGIALASLVKGALGSLVAIGLLTTFSQMAFFMNHETIAGIEVVHDDIKIIKKDEALFEELSERGVTRVYLHDRGVGCNNIQAVALMDGQWVEITSEFLSLTCRQES